MKTAMVIATALAMAGGSASALAQDTQTSPGSGGVVQDVRDAINRQLGGQQAQPQPRQQDRMAPAGTYLREVDDDEPLRGPANMTVRQMEDAMVYDADGKRIGEVEEVIANNRDQIVGVTVEVGTFLGLRDREVLVPLEQLTVHNGQFRTRLTAEQLRALPEWDDD